MREYFTDRGYAEFLSAFERGEYLARLRQGYQVASAVVQGAPVITDMQVRGGRLGWELQFPVLVTFHAGSGYDSNRFVAQVLVVRVPFDERIAGLGIEQIIATKERRI